MDEPTTHLEQIKNLREENTKLWNWYTELINEILIEAPECWDDDISGDVIAIQYVRHLEEEVRRLEGRMCNHDHEG